VHFVGDEKSFEQRFIGEWRCLETLETRWIRKEVKTMPGLENHREGRALGQDMQM
jgi:hypothetical protein